MHVGDLLCDSLLPSPVPHSACPCRNIVRDLGSAIETFGLPGLTVQTRGQCVMVAAPQQHESECGVRIIETILELAGVGATLVADMPCPRAGHSRIRLAAMIAGVVPFSGFMFHGE